MAIKGFSSLTAKEMEEIIGGKFSCPRSKAEFQRTFGALTKTQQQAYIVEKYCGNIDYNYSEDYFEIKIIIASRSSI